MMSFTLLYKGIPLLSSNNSRVCSAIGILVASIYSYSCLINNSFLFCNFYDLFFPYSYKSLILLLIFGLVFLFPFPLSSLFN